MAEVPAKDTPVQPIQVERAFTKALELKGYDDRPDMLALLMAHSDLETATWTAVQNYNLGKIISTSEAQEYYRGTDSGNIRNFRSWPTLDAGAQAMVAQLTSDTRPQWRKGLESGDPDTFVEHLAGRRGGPAYFEADPDRYLATFLERYEKYGEDELTSSPGVRAPAPIQRVPRPNPTRTVSNRPPAISGGLVLLGVLYLWSKRNG